MRTSDLRKVAQWAKSNQSPSEVYNAACRILDQLAGDISQDDARALLRFALHLRIHGEHAPGGGETWRDWEAAAEAHLRTAPGTDVEVELATLKAAVEPLRALYGRWERGLGTNQFPVIQIRRVLNVLETLEKGAQGNGDAEQDEQWRRDERDIDGGSGCEFPRLWPPKKGDESNGDARNPQTQGASEGGETHEAPGGSQ